MDKQYLYNAPWGPLLHAMTLLSICLLGGMVAIGINNRPPGTFGWDMVMIILPLVMLVVSFFFSIRGYLLFPDVLFVQRLGWYSKIPLEGLLSASFDPEATKRMIRRFGNGGMFCFAGSYKSKKIGPFRAFATDFRRTVVLKFADRTIVITPGDPVDFVEKITALRGLAGNGAGGDRGGPSVKS
jgi:hypothetical protein